MNYFLYVAEEVIHMVVRVMIHVKFSFILGVSCFVDQ